MDQRQCIFVGTTNDESYLQNETGDRRERETDELVLYFEPEEWELLQGAAEILQMTAEELAAWCIRRYLAQHREALGGKPDPH